MTVRTPEFIVHECERLIKAIPIEHWPKAYAILKQLQRMNSVKKAIRLVKNMSELEEVYVYPRMTPRLFKRSLISASLIKALEQYANQEEAKEMLETVKKMASFELSWCQDDEEYNWDRTFNVVKFPKEWKRICARAEVLPSKGNIEIALEIKKPKKTKTAEKAWEEVEQNYTFAEHDYEIWFRQKPRACYYIYLPYIAHS